MFCTNCGTEIEDNVKFCTNCGAPMSNTVDESKATIIDSIQVEESATSEAP